MAEPSTTFTSSPTSLSAIQWREAFPFTHLFRSFRIAIHPSKIVLGLIALLLLWAGGSVLDYCTPIHDRAVPDEVAQYEQFEQSAGAADARGDRFTDVRNALRRQLEATYADQLVRYNIANARDADTMARQGAGLSQLRAAIADRRDTDIAFAQRQRDTELSEARKIGGEERDRRSAAARDIYTRRVRLLYDQAALEYAADQQVLGNGLFATFFSYELRQISDVVAGVRDANVFGRGADISDPSAAGVQPPQNQPGVIEAVLRFFTVGPVWLLTQHPIFFVLLGTYFLVLWAVFGGAISRIAAVHVARDEKLSIRSALQFSGGKFLSFLFAPIIPLLIVLILGLLISAGALLGNIPLIGPIIVGAGLIVALLIAFVMSLVLLGFIGGFHLMYPTIAVEGSDSFDAISRSFSYLYARPWRLAFYTAVAVIYGALTYLFVRLFIYLMLVLTHRFVGLGFLAHADSTAPLWPTMWPSPTTSARLGYQINFLSLGWAQSIGGAFAACWIYVVIAMLGAFAISFYFSSNTIIYYLMRREVDATELDDVYLEQVDEEFADDAAEDDTVGGEPVTPPGKPSPAAAATPPDGVPPSPPVMAPAAPAITAASMEIAPPT